MSVVIFNVGLFLGRHYKGDVITLFCVSVTWQSYITFHAELCN